MRRVVVAMFVLAVSASGLMPAQASEAPPWPLSCIVEGPQAPGQTVVYNDSTGLHVNPGGAPEYVGAMGDWARDAAPSWAACIGNDAELGPVDCIQAVVSNLGAYYEVSGGEIHVNYPALVGDLGACA